MNDPGLDDSVKELTEAQQLKQTNGKSREGSVAAPGDHFLTPTARSPRHQSHNSNGSNGTAGSAKPGQETSTILRPPRASCFWERFSHDSREGDDEGEENARRSQRGSSGLNSPGMEAAMAAEPAAEEKRPGDDEEALRNADDVQAQHEIHLPGWSWLVGTVFPLMSATLGPVANVMSICALVAPWRVFIPDVPGASSQSSDKIPDPAWCLAINAVSLACGFAANVILLLNLARRIQSASLLPFTITLWYISSLLLIALLAVYRQYLYNVPRESYAWSQAFYYGIIAAALYFVIATLLVGNYLSVLHGRYVRQFTLTIAQRTLMLQTMSLMMWLCLGAGVFARLEGWAYLDGIYFCDTTFLVVGLGDYTLTTTAGRALLFPYAALGVVIVGLIVSSVRGLVLERGKRKVKRRMLEKQREVFVNGGNHHNPPPAELAESERERFEMMRKRSQSWTYFQSLYFCYTAILTIGYGDFHPTSNSAKPFFVIWSLLAVPMMTILVSNLGDTIIIMIKNVTLSLGEYTILPNVTQTNDNESSASKQDQDEVQVQEESQKPEKSASDRRDDEIRREQADLDEQMDDPDDVVEKQRLQRRGTGLLQQEEKEEEANEGAAQDPTAILLHELAYSVQKLLPDLIIRPPKKYPYDEWQDYLRLLNTPGPWDNGERLEIPEEGEKSPQGETDWLGEQSPLMSQQSETEWLLTRLCGRLEECLRAEKEQTGRQDKGKQQQSDEGRPGRSGSTGSYLKTEDI
ncbi:hypothetical protein ABW21_db0207198 [Orbilia brochopaga]|nr:hypothetical protein ABW21_db0207198 [Drechslerella brochopaga]